MSQQLIRAADLRASVDLAGEKPVLSVVGALDDASAPELILAIEQLADEHGCCISLDLGGVEQMTPDALRLLAESAGAFQSRQRRLHLVRASCSVRGLLEALPLSDVFCLEDQCRGDYCLHRLSKGAGDWELDVFSLPAELARCREARKRVDRVAEAMGFCEMRRRDVMTAVGEATANAVKHGCAGEDSSFTVVCLGTREAMCVSVVDDGPGFCPDSLPDRTADPLSEFGRGVHFIKALMDEAVWTFAGGTTVRMVKRMQNEE